MLILYNYDTIILLLNDYINIYKLKQLCLSLRDNEKINTITKSDNNWWNLRRKHREILLNSLITPIKYYWRCRSTDITDLNIEIRDLNYRKPIKMSKLYVKIISNKNNSYGILKIENCTIYSRKHFLIKCHIMYENNEYRYIIYRHNTYSVDILLSSEINIPFHKLFI